MIKKDDVMELHDIIISLEKRQEAALTMAFHVMEDLKSIGEMLQVLTREYKQLKEKAAE